MNKMLQPIEKKFRIILLSGLHIGGSKEGLKIGGIDSPVVKNPLNQAPYIPGSSIKGKMRSLLEMIYHPQAVSDGRPVSTPENIISRSFGCASNNAKIASRLIFGDFSLNDEWKNEYEKLKSDFFEDKAENTVPRFLKGSANPRHIERVPAGVVFEGSIVLIPEEGEYGISKQDLEDILKDGVELLNKTYLGGGGSRGSGRISMELID